MRAERVLIPLVALQSALMARIIWRLTRSAAGGRIEASEAAAIRGEAPTEQQDIASVSVLVPVLNEVGRLEPCLDGLTAQGLEVAEILVVDGGSSDGTRQLVATYVERDARVRLVDASPIQRGWNGKAWGLHIGVEATDSGTTWVLTIDADVRPRAALTSALLVRARKQALPALSVATRQMISGVDEALIHPALLTTLVYRFGIPGRIAHHVRDVLANGQCMLLRKDALAAVGGFGCAHDSTCEDVTIARALVAAGFRVGFYEAGDLVSVKMYQDGRDAWRNWSRSLPMRDRFSRFDTLIGWLEVTLVQALPLPLLVVLASVRRAPRAVLTLNCALAAMRLGVLFGTRRAYTQVPWTYWLSPLLDLPVAAQFARSALRRRHLWRGRVLIRGGTP